MSDLIKREDAIKAMEQRYEDILRTFKRKVKIGEKAIVLDMIGCVKNLPSADRPQGWIPCKERLPREYEVLCCDIYKNCIVGHPFADDSANTGFCAESEGEFMYECVAWMPLPKPWKGADDEQTN